MLFYLLFGTGLVKTEQKPGEIQHSLVPGPLLRVCGGICQSEQAASQRIISPTVWSAVCLAAFKVRTLQSCSNSPERKGYCLLSKGQTTGPRADRGVGQSCESFGDERSNGRSNCSLGRGVVQKFLVWNLQESILPSPICSRGTQRC